MLLGTCRLPAPLLHRRRHLRMPHAVASPGKVYLGESRRLSPLRRCPDDMPEGGHQLCNAMSAPEPHHVGFRRSPRRTSSSNGLACPDAPQSAAMYLDRKPKTKEEKYESFFKSSKIQRPGPKSTNVECPWHILPGIGQVRAKPARCWANVGHMMRNNWPHVDHVCSRAGYYFAEFTQP